ncbi:MAG: CoA transferase [Sandaracinaceae bacterium]|nr:CoA transferase [Sandaracinaceae bacterium]
MTEQTGPLAGVRVLDLSRILAGPTCTQLLGDLGADVVKVERPERGDDTRAWGPPFTEPADGEAPQSAYFLCANRNKRSVAIDIATDDGAALVRRLAARADVLIENYKVGALARYGLDYASLALPRLVYCSITGFGQTGPRARGVGYDVLAQAMGGIMSLTGEPEGAPMKVGVGIADVMCGMYACVAILAALRHRDRTGEGQHLDIALLDTQVSWLINAGADYLVSGRPPARRGNAHPHIVPYQLFETHDGHVVLAAGNDEQFARMCEVMVLERLAYDPRYATNAARVVNRDTLIPMLAARLRERTSADWERALSEAGVPCGPVHDVAQVFSDPQVLHRGMQVRMAQPRASSGHVDLIGNPIHASRTPPTYRRPPPALGEHKDEVIADWLSEPAI